MTVPNKFDTLFDTLVLGSGGSEGLSILGTLHHLSTEQHISFFKNYAGVSVGAMICYLLIIGFRPIEIMMHLCQTTLLNGDLTPNFNNLTNRRGIFDFNIIVAELERLTLLKRQSLPTMENIYDEYHVNLIIVTVDATDNQTLYLDHRSHPKLDVITAIKLSSAIPFIFAEVKYQGKCYIDGAFGDDLPVSCFGRQNRILTINLELSPLSSDDNFMSYLSKILWTPMNLNFEKNKLFAKQHHDQFVQIMIPARENRGFSFDISIKTMLDMFQHGFEKCKFVRKLKAD
jgi:predicted acylesterase/phospholipase RssA